MDPTAAIELVLLLLAIATALAFVAKRIRVAYPIVLVLGGLALGLLLSALPEPPSVELPPSLVFLLFLPPILFGAAYFTPIRDFKANLRPIGLLAVGLVLFSTLVVGCVALALMPELGAAAFALGAIVAPPDAVAATAIFRRLGVAPRIVTILEGESLVNDATALILYRAALVAIAGSFSVVGAGAEFFVRGGRRHRGRGGGRGRAERDLAARLGSDARDRDLAARAVRRLPAGRGDPRQRGARRRHRGSHRRPARSSSPVAERSAHGHGRLVGRPVHDQRLRVPADRRPAAIDPRCAHRLPGGPAHRARAGDQPDRDRRPDRVGLPGDLRAALGQRQAPGARPDPAGRGDLRHLLGGDARCRLARRGTLAAVRRAGSPAADLPDAVRDPGDPRRPGPDPAVDRQATRGRVRLGHRAGVAGRPGGGHRRRTRAARPAGDRVSRPPRARRQPPSRARARGDPHGGGRRGRATSTRPPRNGSSTRRSGWRWSPRSAMRSSVCATTASSGTTPCD